MPFVRISLKDNRSEKVRQSIGDCVHRAMVKAIGIPEGDRFQVITAHDADLIYDPSYWVDRGVGRQRIVPIDWEK